MAKCGVNPGIYLAIFGQLIHWPTIPTLLLFPVIVTARLMPFISFDFISYAAGLSTIKIRSFLIATGIGMLPATIVYTVFGSEMEKLNAYSSRLFTFSILAVLALVLIWTVLGIYKRRKDTAKKRDILINS